METHINMKRGRLLRGLYSSPSRETLWRQNKVGRALLQSFHSKERCPFHSCHSQCSTAMRRGGSLGGLEGGGWGPLSSPIRRLLIAYALPQPHEPPYPPLLITLIAMKPSGHIAMYKNLKSPTYARMGAP